VSLDPSECTKKRLKEKAESPNTSDPTNGRKEKWGAPGYTADGSKTQGKSSELTGKKNKKGATPRISGG